MSDLLPCPFENVKKDTAHRVYYLEHDGQYACNCGARGPVMAYNEATARIGWNTRPAKPLTVEQIDEIIKASQSHDREPGPYDCLDDHWAMVVAKAIHAALPDQQELVEALKKAIELLERFDNNIGGDDETLDKYEMAERIETLNCVRALAKFGG